MIAYFKKSLPFFEFITLSIEISQKSLEDHQNDFSFSNHSIKRNITINSFSEEKFEVRLEFIWEVRNNKAESLKGMQLIDFLHNPILKKVLLRCVHCKSVKSE